MSTVTIHTELGAEADVVFDAVTTVDAFRLVTAGLLTYLPARDRTGRLHEGLEMRGWLLLGGVLPFSLHRITIERIDHASRTLFSDEGGGLIRTWRHRITVTSTGPGRCRYEDEIDIDAGVLTPVVSAFAAALYRLRQRRWRRLAPLLALAAEGRGSGAGAGAPVDGGRGHVLSAP